MYNPLIGTTFLMSSIFTPLNDIYPGGQNILFEIKPEGIIVTGGYDIKIDDGIYNPLKHSDISIGDIIIEIDNKPINSIKEFTGSLESDSRKDSYDLTIKRDKSKIHRKLKVYKINKQIKSGLYVKERVLGVGTLTFIDTDNNIYGALGHEVIDSNSSTMIDVNSGSIYEEDVIKISKGENGNPGEKTSKTTFSNRVGTIFTNTEYGIFGYANNQINTSYSIELAKPEEVKLGKATILTCIEGDKIEEFEIEITSLKKQTTQSLKGICFKIVDKRLLNKTGGVFSGMSGSPIIQNNKLVGAVTHVIVDDIKSGYGVYIQYMYEEAVESLNKVS